MPSSKKKHTTIALSMIVKDDTEAPMLARCLNSFLPYVDAVYVCGTGLGKKKKIKKIVKKVGKYQEITPKTNPEVYFDFGEGLTFANFGAARNVALEMVSDNFDWVLWADVDDVLQGGNELRDVADMAEKKKADAVAFSYWYAVILDDRGRVKQVVIDHTKERLFKKRIFEWQDRLHENIFPRDSNYKPVRADWSYNEQLDQRIAWIHLNTEERTLATQKRNARILELQNKERESSDPRDFHYLGKTYFDMGELDISTDYFNKHLEKSGWNEERALSLEYLALIKQKQGRYRESIDILLRGLKEFPMLHTLYLRLSAAYFETGQVDFAKQWLHIAEKLPVPQSSTAVTNRYEIKQLLVALKMKEAIVDQNLKEAKHWAEIRADLMDKDDGLLEEIKETQALNYAATGLFNISKWLKENGHVDLIAPMISKLPSKLTDEPYMKIITQNILPSEKWEKGSIAYIATHGGPHFEKWGHDSVERGIGGSETAVIELSRRWAKRGRKVVVYADTSTPGMHDGVEWRQPWKLNWKDEFDTVIIWRMSYLLDNDIKARRIFYDAHDVESQVAWTQENMNKVDKVFFKSNYHRRFVPKLPDEKAVVISNGI